MRRFLITSPKFSGTAEICYNDKGSLCLVNMMEVEIEQQVILQFIGKVSPCIDTIAKWFSSETTIVEAEYIVSFEVFWNKYGRKINRKRAEDIWVKLPKQNQVKAYFGIDAYDKFLKRESWRTKLDPDTYLRNRYFENEY